MKKGKKAQQSIVIAPTPVLETEPPPLDLLLVKIKSLRITGEDTTCFSINVTFYDQLILSGVIKSTPMRAVVEEQTVLVGRMYYDPSDYERMSLIPDNPLCVHIQPLKNVGPNLYSSYTDPSPKEISFKINTQGPDANVADISCCNVDILRLYLDKTKKHVKKRMQPLVKPSILHRKSWDNLPLLNMKLEVVRNELNGQHHEILKQANFMKLTLIGAYNMIVPYSNEYVYTAATRMPLQNATEFGLVTFSQGQRVPKNFCSLNFNPKWESLRVGERNFTKGDEKFKRGIGEIQNDDDIPLQRYMDKEIYSTIWGSFHRTLMLGNTDTWLWKHIRRYKWPIEVHIYGETRGFSFMGFMNLFKLLYPGEDTVRIAVPLQWINAETMQQTCGCDLMLTPNDRISSTVTNTQRTPRSESPGTFYSLRDDADSIRATGCDDNNAFVLVEVKLSHALRQVVIPPYISTPELNQMLEEMERAGPLKRKCTGRGQQDREWKLTVKNAAAALRKVPYYGMTEFCNFNRQLSETRTRVELTTSCWQGAAVYINNNFVVQDFEADETYEEMLIMAHACLMRSAIVTLVGEDNSKNVDPTLRAARHARQMQDITHAVELYLQLVVEKPHDACCWRELSTCLKDVDRDWATVCINKAVVLDPRQPLSLLSKGCMLFEEDPDLAEPFFVAILALYPYWSTGWVIANAFYIQRQLYHMAEKILECNRSTFKENKAEHIEPPRNWERELGDWWDYTPILPGMSPYYDAADCLLRIRAIGLAEVCVSLALCDGGETAAYYQLVALCCRLQGNIEDALCHVRAGIHKYGEISYLRSLEAECCHRLNDIPGTKAAFEKAGSGVNGYSVLLSIPCREQQRARTILVDLSRRQPSAYVWLALATDWMTRAAAGETSSEADTVGEASAAAPVAAKTCAAMCAIQALKWDRRAARAWVLLAQLVQPSARRLHCMQMAYACGYVPPSEEKMETGLKSKQSFCNQLGKALKECRCFVCEMTKV